VLLDLKYDLESNTKKVEDIHSFPTGIYLSSPAQQFRFYDFLQDGGLLKLHFWADCSLQEKLKSGVVQLVFFP
jgi:hypothetical protein